jgi:Recombination endonuclease VII
MKEAYIKSKYGITLAEREEIMQLQDYKCPGCGRDLRECRPEVDHEHVTMKMIKCQRVGKVWLAGVTLSTGFPVVEWAKTKSLAIKLVKDKAKRPSVRGVCCGGRYAGCNRKMGRLDNIQWLINTVNYLKDPPARRILS